MSYRSVWYDVKKRETFINTRTPNGGQRTIDEMLKVYRTYLKFRSDSSPLHEWSGWNGDHECVKCGAWTPGYTRAEDLPKRGCNMSKTLVLVNRRSAA